LRFFEFIQCRYPTWRLAARDQLTVILAYAELSPPRALISVQGPKLTQTFLTDLVPSGFEANEGDQLMLDGKRYYAHFPDEYPGNNPIFLRTSALITALRALEKELRPFIPTTK
jgi:hypothetical protein